MKLAYVGTKLFPKSSHQDTEVKLMQVQPEASKWNVIKETQNLETYISMQLRNKQNSLKRHCIICLVCIKTAFMILLFLLFCRACMKIQKPTKKSVVLSLLRHLKPLCLKSSIFLLWFVHPNNVW
jgi:hypothetical protein